MFKKKLREKLKKRYGEDADATLIISDSFGEKSEVNILDYIYKDMLANDFTHLRGLEDDLQVIMYDACMEELKNAGVWKAEYSPIVKKLSEEMKKLAGVVKVEYGVVYVVFMKVFGEYIPEKETVDIKYYSIRYKNKYISFYDGKGYYEFDATHYVQIPKQCRFNSEEDALKEMEKIKDCMPNIKPEYLWVCSFEMTKLKSSVDTEGEK